MEEVSDDIEIRACQDARGDDDGGRQLEVRAWKAPRPRLLVTT